MGGHGEDGSARDSVWMGWMTRQRFSTNVGQWQSRKAFGWDGRIIGTTLPRRARGRGSYTPDVKENCWSGWGEVGVGHEAGTGG